MIYNNNNFNKEPQNYMKKQVYKFSSTSYFTKKSPSNGIDPAYVSPPHRTSYIWSEESVTEKNESLIKRIPKITINKKFLT